MSGSRAPPSIADPRASRGQGLGFEQAERLASEKRDIQQELEALQRAMQNTRTQSRERTPQASERVAEASAALDENGTASRLARSALEIERGRGVQAAARDGLISDSLEQLERGLDEAARIASTEGAGRNDEPQAEASDLLAELGALRRALENAQAQARAQGAQSQGGERSGQQPNGEQGQPGQQGGQQAGQQQGNGQQGGADGDSRSANAQAGSFPNGGTNGGGGRLGLPGDRFGGIDNFRSGAFIGTPRISGERLAQLRSQLRPGELSEEDIRALRELSDRLRRAGADPMAAEYQRMVTLVNQLELAALRAEQATADARGTRALDRVDESSRYRDNVAEYYRRLGGADERKQ